MNVKCYKAKGFTFHFMCTCLKKAVPLLRNCLYGISKGTQPVEILIQRSKTIIKRALGGTSAMMSMLKHCHLTDQTNENDH